MINVWLEGRGVHKGIPATARGKSCGESSVNTGFKIEYKGYDQQQSFPDRALMPCKGSSNDCDKR